MIASEGPEGMDNPRPVAMLGAYRRQAGPRPDRRLQPRRGPVYSVPTLDDLSAECCPRRRGSGDSKDRRGLRRRPSWCGSCPRPQSPPRADYDGHVHRLQGDQQGLERAPFGAAVGDSVRAAVLWSGRLGSGPGPLGTTMAPATQPSTPSCWPGPAASVSPLPGGGGSLSSADC
jgi:hypothetical protein